MNTPEKKGREQKFLFLYTVIFILAAFLAFHYFPEQGKRMVWKRDGLTQHYVALRYYMRWGRSILRSILAGKPAFPTYNLHLGFGADLFTTFQYYVIGDPFSLPAVFVPQKYLLDFHDAMIILRLYLAGICFDRYCCEMGHRGLGGNICGAILYVFGNFTLFGMRHPYFLNALIWFPLLLLGAEHILRGRRGRLFTAAVFLSCISNFYFFYMLVIMTVLYVVWRALRIHLFPCFARDNNLNGSTEGGVSRGFGEAWKQIGLLALRFLARAALGVCMGMVLFLPVVLRFISDPRVSEQTALPMLYPDSFYQGFAEAFLSFGTKKALEYWTCMGYGAAGLLGVLVLFLMPAKKHADLKLGWCAMLAMVLLPQAGSIMNGFTYPSNRWIWAFGMLTAYIAAVVLPEAGSLSWIRMALLAGGLGIYAAVCRAGEAPRTTMDELLLAAAAILALRLLAPAVESIGKSKGIRRAACSAVLIAVSLATVWAHAYICFVKGRRNSDIDQYKSDHYIEAMAASDAKGVRKIVDEAVGQETFYRYSGRGLANNFSVIYDVSNTQYFWSLSDSAVEQFFTETGQSNESVHLYDNIDNRTMLDEVAAIKYYKRSDGSLLPFGYQKLEGYKFDNRGMFGEDTSNEPDELPVFSFGLHRNEYALPLGFTSGQYISKKEWQALSIPRKQEALMQGIVLEDSDIEAFGINSVCRKAELTFTEQELPDRPQAEDGIEITYTDDGGLRVTVLDTGALVHMVNESLEKTAACETSIVFTGMHYEELSQEDAARADALKAEQEGLQTSGGETAQQTAGTAGQKKTARDPASIETLKVTVKAQRNGETVSDKEVSYALEDNPWGTGRTDFVSCCGYSDTPLEGITLKFPRKGVYTFRELKTVCQPMDSYPAQVQAFRECVLEDLEMHGIPDSGAVSAISGKIAVPEDRGGAKRLLCLQIPKSPGMRAFVDGRETEILQADTMFSALLLDPGEHKIEFRYRTPGLAAGAAVSVTAFGIFAVELLLGLLRRRREGQK